MLTIPNTQQNCGKEKVAILHQSESSWWHLPCQWEVKKKTKSARKKKVSVSSVIFETTIPLPDSCLSRVIDVIVSQDILRAYSFSFTILL